MKKQLILSLVLILSSFLVSCDLEPAKSTSKKGVKDGVVKQYWGNKKLKTEITYKSGKKHGLAKSYYKDGKLRQQITYKDGKKNGDAISYYANGKVFQSTPYVNNKIEGIRKKYRQNGKLMAEVPYFNDLPCQGLKEYLLNGQPKTEYPKIKFTPKDRILLDGSYDLEISMSDGTKNVDYYINTPLNKEGCLTSKFGSRSNYKPGVLRLSYKLPQGGFIMEEISVLAVAKTVLGNPFVVTGKYNLAIENRGY